MDNPGTRWIAGNCQVKNAPPVVCDDEEAVQHSKCQSRYREEVHRSDDFPVVAQKGSPSLCWLRAPGRFAHPTQDRSFRNLEAKHGQFAVKARSTQVGFSATIRKMSSRSSKLIRFLPRRTRCRESRVQYILNPRRCHRTTVSGSTRTSACFHPLHSDCNITQNNRSETAKRGFGCFCFKTEGCCRSMRFSGRRSRRELRKHIAKMRTALSKRPIRPTLHGFKPSRHQLSTA